MSNPLVSVVVPSYQQVDYIEETVRSVLEEQNLALELIVSDHSSTDGTWDRLQQFARDSRVRLLQTPTGGGAAANWAAVTAEASGEYIKLLPGDDTVRPGSLARQAAIMQADSSIAMVAGRRDIVDARSRIVTRRRGLQGLESRLSGAEAVRRAVRSGTNPFGEPGAVLIRRSALEAAGGWASDWSYAIDVATYFNILEHGDFAADQEVASTFRISASQWSVALVRAQSSEIAELFRTATARHSGIRDADVALGTRRAHRMALQRRLVYLLMKGRMQ